MVRWKARDLHALIMIGSLSVEVEGEGDGGGLGKAVGRAEGWKRRVKNSSQGLKP